MDINSAQGKILRNHLHLRHHRCHPHPHRQSGRSPIGRAPDVPGSANHPCLITKNKNRSGSDRRGIFGLCQSSRGRQPRYCPHGALLAGLPIETRRGDLQRLCASGLTSVNMAARAIPCGEGGCSSQVEWKACRALPTRYPKPNAHSHWDTTCGIQPWVGAPASRFRQKGYTIGLGETAENLAELYHISRLAQDAFALQSHQRAIAAIDSGKFRAEITSVSIPQRKAERPLRYG